MNPQHHVWVNLRIGALITTGILLLSCQGPRSSSTGRLDTDYAGQYNPAMPRINLLGSPGDLRDDYVYPPFLTRSVYRWNGREMEWRVQLPSQRYAYAGFVFRKSYDLSAYRSEARLVFRMRPASMAQNLVIGLVDGAATPDRVVVDVPFVIETSGPGDGWALITIMLDAFDSSGAVLGNTASEADLLQQPFDWKDVQEICLLSPNGIERSGEITIKNLRLQR